MDVLLQKKCCECRCSNLSLYFSFRLNVKVFQQSKMADTSSNDLQFEYHCAKAFYRSNEGKAFKLSYDEKLRFIALSKLVAKGPYDPERNDGSQDSALDVSYFNLVGNDRKAAWQKLGNMSKEDAMIAFVKELRGCCALFEPWYKAHLNIELEKRRRENGSLLDSSYEGVGGKDGISGGYANENQGEILRKDNKMSENSVNSLQSLPWKNNGAAANNSKRDRTEANVENIKGEQKNKIGTTAAAASAAGTNSNSTASSKDNSSDNSASFNASQFVNYSSANPGFGVTSGNTDNLSHIHQIEQQKALIKNVLNAQTFQQFKQYAVSRYPQDKKEQEKLIGELQEQHFQQYMQHIYFQQIAHLKASAQQNNSSNIPISPQLNSMTTNTSEDGFTQIGASSKLSFEKETKSSKDNVTIQNETNSAANAKSETSEQNAKTQPTTGDPEKGLYSPSSDNLLVANPSMWTNKNMKEFKDLVKKDSNLVIRVGRGELVTIRVPTHEDGSFLFWEFATDHYDIGFGLHFEWTISPTNEITITAEEPDEDEDDEIVDSGNPNDVEKMQHFDGDGDKPALDVIAPILRRDSHTEVQAGSHEYPGQGCYLLKFDNTFSLFRGKTLYYRVYYTK